MSEGPRRADGITDRLRARAVATVQFWHAVIERARTAEIAFLAAAVAYYAFLSLLPVLLLILAMGTALGGEVLADAIVVAAGDILTPTGRVLVHDALENAAGRTGATIVSVLLLVWSMLRVFRALDIAFLLVYGTEAPASLRDQIRDGAVAVLGVGIGIVVMFGVGAFVSAVNLDPVLDLLGILVLPTVLTVVFLPLYYVFPDVKLRVGDVLPGTLFAAVGWTVLQTGFHIYAANAAQYQAYGVLGGVLLLVIWFYLAAIVLLLGAVVNVVLSDRAAPPVTPGETSAVGPPSGRSVEPRTDSESGSVASSDRQLQQSPGTQRNTTQMVSEDDNSHRDGNERPRRTESSSDRDEGNSSSRKERDRPARNERKRLVDSDEPVDSREPIDSRERVDSYGSERFRSDGGSPADNGDDSSAHNDDESSVHGRDEESQNEDKSRSDEDRSGDVSPIEDELMNEGGSPDSDGSPSDDGRSLVDSGEGAHGESDDESFDDHDRSFSGDGSDNDDGARDDGSDSPRNAGTEASREEDVPSWKGGGASRYEDDESLGVEGDPSPGGDGSIGAGSATDDGEERDEGVDPSGAPDITELQREVDRLRSELDEFERDVESRTVEKPKLESELKHYVRKRMRRGHARGWGPYLVLLYGTILTLGGFYWLDGIYAIGAMLILALSTLGLYVLFVLFGIGLNVAGVPYRAIDAYRRRRN